MSDRVEVLPGPGTVLRHGRVAVWAGPSSSAALLAFLAQSALNVGELGHGGLQIVDHIAGILSTRDPEPGAPFAVIGPSLDAWITVLHGPVQLWDGTRWLAPTPQTGWLRADVRPQPAVCIGPAGSVAPILSSDSPYDLRAGTVPGGGLILVPDSVPHQRVEPPAAPVSRPTAPPAPVSPALVAPAPVGAEPVGPEPVARGTSETPTATTATTATTGGPGGPPSARHWMSLAGLPAPPGPALPLGGAIPPDGRPQVPGVLCPAGHFNHPAARVCAWCTRDVAPGQPPTIGPRPVLGVLVTDDGATYRLDVDQVLGSDPTTDHGVATGRIRGVALRGAPGQLAPTHAEIRLSEWTVTVIDRGSAGGTSVVGPDMSGWVRLTPYQPVLLPPRSHLSIGQRVLTFVSPWP
jgi:hypothetical protein